MMYFMQTLVNIHNLMVLLLMVMFVVPIFMYGLLQKEILTGKFVSSWFVVLLLFMITYCATPADMYNVEKEYIQRNSKLMQDNLELRNEVSSLKAEIRNESYKR